MPGGLSAKPAVGSENRGKVTENISVKENKKNWIIIPALEPGEKLCGYIKQLNQRICASVLVIDDGSGPAYGQIFGKLNRMDGCTVLRHDVNRGKGGALKTGFKYVQEHTGNPSRVVCVDCDGQHLPEDVERVLGMTAEEPDALILGGRDFSEAGVPLRCRFGNYASSFIFWMICGAWIRDTQTGLRAFDGEMLPLMRSIPGERFEYETQMLLTCAGRDIPVKTCPIQTVYEENNAGSHFRPMKDSLSVLKVLFSELLRFTAGSLLCAVLDVMLFWAVLEGLSTGSVQAGLRQIVCAAVSARILSAGVNYIVNRNYVFHRDERNSGRGKRVCRLPRYIVLCFGLAVSSAAAVSVLNRLFPAAALWKVICDTVLFFVSYRLQKNWVFAEGGADGTVEQGSEEQDAV